MAQPLAQGGPAHPQYVRWSEGLGQSLPTDGWWFRAQASLVSRPWEGKRSDATSVARSNALAAAS